MMMSVYMTISLTVERYISVVHPLLSRRHQSIRSCLYLAAPGMIFSLLFTLPNYFALHTEPIMDNRNFLDMQQVAVMINFKIQFICLYGRCSRMILLSPAAAGSLSWPSLG